MLIELELWRRKTFNRDPEERGNCRVKSSPVYAWSGNTYDDRL